MVPNTSALLLLILNFVTFSASLSLSKRMLSREDIARSASNPLHFDASSPHMQSLLDEPHNAYSPGHKQLSQPLQHVGEPQAVPSTRHRQLSAPPLVQLSQAREEVPMARQRLEHSFRRALSLLEICRKAHDSRTAAHEWLMHSRRSGSFEHLRAEYDATQKRENTATVEWESGKDQLQMLMPALEQHVSALRRAVKLGGVVHGKHDEALLWHADFIRRNWWERKDDLWKKSHSWSR